MGDYWLTAYDLHLKFVHEALAAPQQRYYMQLLVGFLQLAALALVRSDPLGHLAADQHHVDDLFL